MTEIEQSKQDRNPYESSETEPQTNGSVINGVLEGVRCTAMIAGCFSLALAAYKKEALPQKVLDTVDNVIAAAPSELSNCIYEIVDTKAAEQLSLVGLSLFGTALGTTSYLASNQQKSEQEES